MAELKYWLWLANRVRPAAAKELMLRFDAPSALYHAGEELYEELDCLNKKEREKLLDKSLKAESRCLGDCEKLGVRILTIGDAEYPARLKSIYDPPTVLYLKGSLPNMDEEAAVAVVGTRDATAYGLRAAERLAMEISRHGGLVISGLARGIDSAAVRGALRAGGRAVGVLGCAIDKVYPPENRRLFKDVAAQGCLISEYGPGTKTDRYSFPARNRIMSGLSLGVLVVEAPAKSGALITADYALEQGRDLFAVPGNLDTKSSEGCNSLLKDGASLVTEGWDVLEGYREIFPEKLFRNVPQEADFQPISKPETEEKDRVPAKNPVDKPEGMNYIDLKEQLENLTADELAAVSVMGEKPMHVDDIIDLSGLAASRVLAALTMLQMKGYVAQSPGKRFSLVITKK